MGFLDKAKETLSEATKAAQEGVADMSAKRKADGLLRELGAWTYAKHKGGFPDAEANIALDRFGKGLGNLLHQFGHAFESRAAEHRALGDRRGKPFHWFGQLFLDEGGAGGQDDLLAFRHDAGRRAA